MTTSPATLTTAPILVSPLVSTQWLCDHLGSDALVVLDATVLSVTAFDGRQAWLSGLDDYLVTGHIPSAVFADLLEELSDVSAPFGFTRPSTARFEEVVTAFGITNGTTVVVYDSAQGQWAARLWWLFRAFGYDQVAVLDGGLTKWNAEERPVETGYTEPAPAADPFFATEQPHSWVDKSFVESVLDGRTDALLLCALAPREFSGEAGRRSRPGHIPGSVNVSATRLIDRETNKLLRRDALRVAFEQIIDEALAGRRVVVYCGSGILAASDALALTLLGVPDVSIYDGSLAEWVADPAAPVVATVAAH
ncbi:sulfurtransferase [Subtercola sp. YIM 133946]|uniref:sulfurtransferase n=1 Tax=Subtercola sp. YIM 133946 TaxID=3118909 RepID=UPI002F95C535